MRASSDGTAHEGFATWIGDPCHPTAPAPTEHDAGTRNEGPEIEGPVVKDTRPLGVRRVVELEAAIEPVTVDEISAHPSAHGI